MNSVNISGRLTADPVVKEFGDNKQVAKFCVAIARPGRKDETDFIDCVAWDNTSAFIAAHFVKGKPIEITGELQQERWEDKDGNGRSKVVIKVGTWAGAGFTLSDRNADIPSSKPAAVAVPDDDIPF